MWTVVTRLQIWCFPLWLSPAPTFPSIELLNVIVFGLCISFSLLKEDAYLSPGAFLPFLKKIPSAHLEVQWVKWHKNKSSTGEMNIWNGLVTAVIEKLWEKCPWGGIAWVVLCTSGAMGSGIIEANLLNCQNNEHQYVQGDFEMKFSSKRSLVGKMRLWNGLMTMDVLYA